MIEFLTNNFVPLMFVGLVVFLLMGFPVAFSLSATGLFFGLIGMELGLFPANLFQALPLRVFGIMQNDTLLAIPFFTLMGIILERSRMAEDLLETVGQVFGPVRGGLGIAVILVGALLAATTGVVAASVISMGLIALPIMLRYGYNRTIATGTITASGTLAQALPPSLVLIVLADQLGRSVGDMYAGALIPGAMLVGLYLLFVIGVAIVKPSWVPALPPEARVYSEPSGASGHKSLVVLLAISTLAGLAWAQVHESVMNPIMNRTAEAPRDEIFILSLSVGSFVAFTLALINKVLKLGLFSRLTERVTFALIPPLVLIFLVLGTIFLGWATPTEGGAMGALGALILAGFRGTLNLKMLMQAMENS
ncbi:MAG: TRAP transporter large permease subunit, partial [Burkholderiales bacterium]